MAFFNEPIETFKPPPDAVRLRHLGATSAVMKYAPPRLRPDTAGDAKAQADAAYWRERAFKAETRLRALETRLQSLAARARGG